MVRGGEAFDYLREGRGLIGVLTEVEDDRPLPPGVVNDRREILLGANAAAGEEFLQQVMPEFNVAVCHAQEPRID